MMLIIYSEFHYIDTILTADKLKSYYHRNSLIKDSLSKNKFTTYRKHFGCNYTEDDHLMNHVGIPLRICPDSVLFTEIIRVNKYGFVKSVEIISQKSTANYIMIYEYNKKGLLSRIFTINNGTEEDLYELKYSY